MFVSVLEGLHQTQGLVHRTTHRQVVDGDLPQDSITIDHKQTPEHKDPRIRGQIILCVRIETIVPPCKKITQTDLYAMPSSSFNTP